MTILHGAKFLYCYVQIWNCYTLLYDILLRTRIAITIDSNQTLKIDGKSYFFKIYATF